MKLNRYLSHGLVAAAAWMVGRICETGVAPGPRVEIAPETAVTQSQPFSTKPVRTPVALVTGLSLTSTAASIVPSPPDMSVSSQETFLLDAPSGIPIVVVRPLGSNSGWSVQAATKPTDGTLFVCTASFGKPKDASGLEFELAAFVAPTEEAAKLYVPGSLLHELPADLISPVVQVARR